MRVHEQGLQSSLFGRDNCRFVSQEHAQHQQALYDSDDVMQQQLTRGREHYRVHAYGRVLCAHYVCYVQEVAVYANLAYEPMRGSPRVYTAHVGSVCDEVYA